MAEAIIQARAVEKYYPQPDGNRIEVIAPTDLEVSPGKIVASAGAFRFGKVHPAAHADRLVQAFLGPRDVARQNDGRPDP